MNVACNAREAYCVVAIILLLVLLHELDDNIDAAIKI